MSRRRLALILFRSVAWSGTGRLGELLALRILDQQRQGATDDLGEIPRGHLVAEQRLRLAKLLAQRPARRELDLEALLAQESAARAGSVSGRDEPESVAASGAPAVGLRCGS
jgi:hypothetical protein